MSAIATWGRSKLVASLEAVYGRWLPRWWEDRAVIVAGATATTAAILVGLGLKALMQGYPWVTVAGACATVVVCVGGWAWSVHQGITEGVFAREVARCCGVWPQEEHGPWMRGRRAATAGALLVVSVALGVAVYVLNHFLTEHLPPPPTNVHDTRGDGLNPAQPVRLWGRQFIEAGLSEELIFRAPVLAVAVMTRTWARWPRVLAVTAVALLATYVFAGTHSEFGWRNVVPAFVIGAVFCGLIIWTKTVWAGAVAHTTHNLFAFGAYF